MYSNSFGWQLFPIYFHLKLHKNANNANVRSYEKTRLFVHKKVDANVSATMLAAKSSAGVTPQVNLRILLHAVNRAHKQGYLSTLA